MTKYDKVQNSTNVGYIVMIQAFIDWYEWYELDD